jgi:tRNASer (uridine44-2'-O)-methyltransferase
VAGIVGHVVDICLTSLEAPRQVALTGRNWNAGGSAALSSVAERLAEAGWDLSRLKAECGGLQTLLRNHHAIFVVRGGAVRLRVPGEDMASGRRIAAKRGEAVASTRKKTKACWHYFNHPDGCPLTDETCCWLHTNTE